MNSELTNVSESALSSVQSETTLEILLVNWGIAHFPECIDAIADHLHDPEYVRKCHGALFRKICSADPHWLWKVIEWDRNKVLALTPYIKSIAWSSMGYPETWGDIPGRMGWRAWIDAALFAGAMDAKPNRVE